MLPPSEAWQIILRHLGIITTRYNLKIHCLVLMSNHFHLLLSTPDRNLDKAMEYLLRETARTINRTSSRINHLYGSPYKWSIIYTFHYYKHAFKYVCRNPVKAKMAKRVEEYPYSTLQGPYFNATFPFKLELTSFEEKYAGDTPLSAKLDWLNLNYEPREYDFVYKAIRRREFRFCLQKTSRHFPSTIKDPSEK